VAAYVANAVASAVADAVKHAGPAIVEWKVNAVPFAKSDGHRHAVHKDILRAIGAGFSNLMLVGPAGSGKTSLADNLAKDLGRPFASVSCSGGTTESAFIGRAVPNLTTGEVAHQTTEFLQRFEAGGVILVDEGDAADATVLLLLNAALANGWIPVPTRPDKPRAVRHADTVILMACNTYGNGADRQYTGRNQLDASTLDRFVGATFTVDYDRDLEARLTGDPALCARVWEIRKAVESNKLRRIVGTRFLLSARRWTAAGDTAEAAIRKCLTGWTEQELSKVGMA
jgi:MoxR-like ATPase